MSKKDFKNNPALAYISSNKENITHEVTQYDIQDDIYEIAREVVQEFTHEAVQEDTHKVIQEDTHESIQEDTHEVIQDDIKIQINGYIRTQGRKGHKKPRINLAFDSDSLLNRIRKQSEKEGKSITQLMNESIITYLNNLNNK